ncbi:hypothetical protein vBValMR11Z_81 [Vibrio phage vB_ValM_R11Z]|nr:hypothetical protein vBValMR11Z_81 [Vibrio phage vB_ValM_R11Z]
MIELSVTVAAILFVLFVIYMYKRAADKQKAENAKSMREQANPDILDRLRDRDAKELRSLNGTSSNAKSRVTHSVRHNVPKTQSLSRTSRKRREDDGIVTNPLHPLNPITDPVGLYSEDEPTRSRPEPSYSAPEPSYSEPERVSSPGSYSFGGSSDSSSSYSSSSDSGSSYSSSDSSSSSSGGGFD